MCTERRTPAKLNHPTICLSADRGRAELMQSLQEGLYESPRSRTNFRSSPMPIVVPTEPRADSNDRFSKFLNLAASGRDGCPARHTRPSSSSERSGWQSTGVSTSSLRRITSSASFLPSTKHTTADVATTAPESSSLRVVDWPLSAGTVPREFGGVRRVILQVRRRCAPHLFNLRSRGSARPRRASPSSRRP